MSLGIYVVGLLLIAAVAWSAAHPLFGTVESGPAEEESRPHERLRRQKEEALSAIREAEFDRELGKISEEDYLRLRDRLEAEALAAMTELERLEGGGHGDHR